MVPIAPHTAPPAQHAVDGACETNGETADAAGERSRVVGLDDEVDVLVLDRELKHTKRRTGRGGERASHGGKHAF